MPISGDPPSRWNPTRRRLLAAGGGLVAAGVFGKVVTGGDGRDATGNGRRPDTTERRATVPDGHVAWSDPEAWADGKVPGPGDRAVIGRHVLLDRSVEVASVLIQAGASLTFPSDVSAQLESRGNVVLHGSIVMKPGTADIYHTLRFVGVDEARFVGGHTESPLDSDVGLWVLGDGSVDAAGTGRLAWTRVVGSPKKGERTFEVDQDPVGWTPGDRIVLVPTEPGSVDGYDDRKIVSVRGTTVTMDAPLSHDHPAFDGHGVRLTAEVLNLTRNVRIEGTPGGRAHIMFLHSGVQRLSYVELTHLGPRKSSTLGSRRPDGSAGVTGRYPVHFHLCDDRTAGSTFKGCVVHDAGQHAFVTHRSHGVTYSDCVAHDVLDDAYWWDPMDPATGVSPPTNDVRYERCVASLVRTEEDALANRLAGFRLLQGARDSCVDSVAVGVRGGKDSAGFVWPEKGDAVWTFRGCVSHNNIRHGTFVWQNSKNVHLVEKFVCYRNGGFGISHGAYRNRYVYRDALSAENGEGALRLHAVSAADPHLELSNLVLDASGRRFAAQGTEHDVKTPPLVPTDINRCTLTGYTAYAYGFTWTGRSAPDVVTFSGCRADNDRRVLPAATAPPDSAVEWTSEGPGADLRGLSFVSARP